MITVIHPGEINGAQLRREINTATGLNLGVDDFTAYEGGVLVINADSSYDAAISAIVAAHVPPSNQALRAGIRDRIAALAGLQVPDMTAAQVRDLVLALAFAAGAITRTGKIRPWDEWGSD